MSTKKLSIIIPVYNVEKYIKKCLDSVFNQNISSSVFEVIVVNDGTQDNSMSIVNDFVKKYDNIVIVEQENKGLSAARNAGLRIAVGDYVWFVDSDDYLTDENVIEKIYSVLEENLDVEIISTGFYLEDELTRDRNIQQVVKDKSFLGKIYGRDEYSLIAKNKGCAPRYIIRRDFLLNNNINFHEGVFHEDCEFVAKLLFFGHKIFLMKDVLYVYLIRIRGSITSTFVYKRLYDCLEIANELINFRNKNAKTIVDEEFLNSTILYLYVYSLELISLQGVEKEVASTKYIEFSSLFRKMNKDVLSFRPQNHWLSLFGTIALFSPKLFLLVYPIYKKIKA